MTILSILYIIIDTHTHSYTQEYNNISVVKDVAAILFCFQFPLKKKKEGKWIENGGRRRRRV